MSTSIVPFTFTVLLRMPKSGYDAEEVVFSLVYRCGKFLRVLGRIS